MPKEIILVDKNNKKIGIDEKIKAHIEARLHRSFSVLVFNPKKELLIQRRTKNKYHSGGLWTNTCCSHPKPGEKLKSAIHRRLGEEMGFDCDLEKIGSFIYKVKFNNGLYENEYNHVFMGFSHQEPKINREEIKDWKWININKLKKDIKKNPNKYTYWFKIIINKYLKNGSFI
ncbi:isopentenyl-diphosphate Delta-isomerase [Patescibacteria group bacterium]|nr:isopentenyl-diphosphate Delta-isomerase [Patescibacteria group bacterium]